MWVELYPELRIDLFIETIEHLYVFIWDSCYLPNVQSAIHFSPDVARPNPPNRIFSRYMATLAHRIFRPHPRELAFTAGVLLIAPIVYSAQPSATIAASSSAVERGRLVYLSEGCIHCHSQPVNPGAGDVLVSDPLTDVATNHQEHAPIGNRRQGPDLSQVASRRSALWLKMHLCNPGEVSGASIMPSYAFLFRDQRGNDLVAYLANLSTPVHLAEEQQWHLTAAALADANPSEGRQLYNQYCATCHNTNGRTRLRWQSEFIESPALLTSGETTSGSVAAMQPGSTAKPESARIDHLARIIKFGIPDSDMAGHEHLPDKDIASLSLWLAQSTAEPLQKN